MKETAARVLLVDADLRRPTIHEAFGVPLLPGLSEALCAGDPRLSVRATPLPGLDLITAGRPETLSSALVGSEAMRALLDQARAQYEWVIVDAPPALALTDASVLTTLVDGTLIVCSAESSRLREIRSVVEQIRAIGGIVLGAVLNRVDMRRHSYYYGRSYSSYYGAADPTKTPARKERD
jgi:capsular exopolysaccharide synthesis family protein